MDISPSKQKILDEALKLFSQNGFEATSVEQITNAVGIRKASFYSHFKSKQEVLDLLTAEILERYDLYAESVQKSWETTAWDCNVTPQQFGEAVFQSVARQFEFLIRDSFFVWREIF